MKILLYCNPSILYETYNRSDEMAAYYLLDPLCKTLIDYHNADVRAIVSDIAYKTNIKSHVIDKLNPIGFSYQDLMRIFPEARSLSEINQKILRNSISDSEQASFQSFIKSTLQDWVPDIIITTPWHCYPLKNSFPDSLFLTLESGVFSRSHYPRTLKLEPVDFANGFLNQFRDELWACPITDRQRKTIFNLQHQLAKNIIEALPKEDKLFILSQKKNFKHLVLLPIIANNIGGESPYDDQLYFMLNILAQIPPSIGVIPTFHDIVGAQVSSRVIPYLQTLYPNLIAYPYRHKEDIAPGSLKFIPFIDAIINCNTMTGVQGLLYGKPLIAIDRKFSHWCASKVGLNDLEEFLSSPMPDNVPVIHWFLTRFNIFDHRFNDPNWSHNHLTGLIERYREHGITFDLFEQIEDIEELSKRIINRNKASIRMAKIIRFIPGPVRLMLHYLRKPFLSR